jgi:uncharacterized membrane protein
MVKVLLKTLVLFLFFILLSSAVYAINVGSVVKNEFVEILSEESVKISMLFWNIEEESYTVKLSVKDAPKNWLIIFDPSEFVLNKSIGEEYIDLPYTDEKIKAKAVNVFVKADTNSKPGKYFIVIRAETKLPQKVNGINVVPERLFEFEIDLKESAVTNRIENGNSVLSLGKEFDLKFEEAKIINSNIKELKNKDNFYIFVMFLVLSVLIIIYKKS